MRGFSTDRAWLDEAQQVALLAEAQGHTLWLNPGPVQPYRASARWWPWGEPPPVLSPQNRLRAALMLRAARTDRVKRAVRRYGVPRVSVRSDGEDALHILREFAGLDLGPGAYSLSRSLHADILTDAAMSRAKAFLLGLSDEEIRREYEGRWFWFDR